MKSVILPSRPALALGCGQFFERQDAPLGIAQKFGTPRCHAKRPHHFEAATGGGGASSLVGAGLEFGLFDNWSAKVEYDHLDLGSKSVTLIGSQTFSNIPNPVVTNPIQRTFDIDQTIQVIKSPGQCPWAFSSARLIFGVMDAHVVPERRKDR
jgi:hypothetical protein